MPFIARRWRRRRSDEHAFQTKPARARGAPASVDMSAEALRKRLDDQVDTYMSTDAEALRDRLDRDVDRYFATANSIALSR